jgi:hypothetical protein
MSLDPVLTLEAHLSRLVLCPMRSAVGSTRYLAVTPGRAKYECGIEGTVDAWAQMVRAGGGWAVRTDDVEDDYAEVRQFPTMADAQAYVSQRQPPVSYVALDMRTPSYGRTLVSALPADAPAHEYALARGSVTDRSAWVLPALGTLLVIGVGVWLWRVA